jgi:hypothetical protein
MESEPQKKPMLNSTAILLAWKIKFKKKQFIKTK